MAFTLAHPAAVLPFRKVPHLALLPMIVGSMIPDIIGFLPHAIERHLLPSHSLPGMVLVDLPAGLLLLFFLRLFKTVLLKPVWQPHRTFISHSIDAYFSSKRPWRIALPSLLLGSFTHLVWDRFTHDTYFGYRHLKFLYTPIFPDGLHPLPIYHLLQYVTSLLGLLVLAWQYQLSLRSSALVTHSPESSGFLKRLLAALAVAALLIGLIRLIGSDVFHESIYGRLSMVFKTAIMSFGVLYLLSGLALAKALPPSANASPRNFQP